MKRLPMAALMVLGLSLGLAAASASGGEPPAPVSAPAAAPAEPAPELADIAPDSPEGQRLRKQPLKVVVHKADGAEVDGRLTSYQSETGVMVIEPAHQFTGREIAAVEIKGPLGPLERPAGEFLKDLLQQRHEAIMAEVRQAKQAGKLDDYVAEQTEKLKKAADPLTGREAIGRLVAAGYAKEMPREAIAARLAETIPALQNEEVRKEVRWTVLKLGGRKPDRPLLKPGQRRGPAGGGAKGPGEF